MRDPGVLAAYRAAHKISRRLNFYFDAYGADISELEKAREMAEKGGALVNLGASAWENRPVRAGPVSQRGAQRRQPRAPKEVLPAGDLDLPVEEPPAPPAAPTRGRSMTPKKIFSSSSSSSSSSSTSSVVSSASSFKKSEPDEDEEDTRRAASIAARGAKARDASLARRKQEADASASLREAPLKTASPTRGGDEEKGGTPARVRFNAAGREWMVTTPVPLEQVDLENLIRKVKGKEGFYTLTGESGSQKPGNLVLKYLNAQSGGIAMVM